MRKSIINNTNTKEHILPYNSQEEIEKYQVQIQILKQQISALTEELYGDKPGESQSDIVAKQFADLETKWKDDADKIVKLSVYKIFILVGK